MKIFVYLFYAVFLTIVFKIGSLIIRKRYKEPSFVGFRVRRPVEALKIVKIIAVIGFSGILLWGAGCFGFTYDFEDYNLGNLNGQNGWVGDTLFKVAAPGLNGTTKLVNSLIYPGATAYMISKTGDSLSHAGLTWLQKAQNIDCDRSRLCFYSDNNFIFGIGFGQFAHFSQYYGATSTGCNQSVVPLDSDTHLSDTEYRIKVEWFADSDTVYWETESATGTFTTTTINAFDFINKVGLVEHAGGGCAAYTTYFDEISSEPPPLPEFRIWGISPANSTEITATSTNFTFGYEGYSSTTWDGILIDFCEETTGICADEEKYLAENLSTNGTKTLSFDNFNFDINGDWYFKGMGYRYFQTATFGQITTWSSNVVSPEYYIKVNFEYLPPVFEMITPATWYASNTEYATPTAFFSTISSILAPLFSKIGEFGSRIEGFFNQDEAYSRGKNIGEILPTFKLYTAQFSFLFGGFPIIEIFILAMVVMVGFFLFKLVFRIVRG